MPDGTSKTPPFFSVITINLNNLSGLEKTYHSLPPPHADLYEWIVIDGASTDGSVDFLKTTNAIWPNTQWVSEKDDGIYDAMNKGAARATGHYYIFMNSGDSFATSQTLTQVQKFLTQKSSAIIYGDSYEASEGKRHLKKSRAPQNIQWGLFTHHQAIFYQAELFKTEQYDTSYKIAADYKFTLNALQSGAECLYIPKPICIFEGGGISQQNVTTGRREQFRARSERGTPLPLNMLIYSAQTMQYFLRRLCPPLYWFLKR